MPKITIEMPSSFAVNIGGEDVTLQTADIAQGTFDAVFAFGWEKCKNAFNSQHFAHRKATGQPWTPSEAAKARADIVARIKSGDWQRQSSSVSDPVGELAKSMARDAILGKARVGAIRSGKLDSAKAMSARPATLRDTHRQIAAFLDRFGAFGGKAGNTFTWDTDAVDQWVKDNDLRKAAADQIKDAERDADDLDLSDLLAD